MLRHHLLDRYSRQGESPIHRADPRLKLVAALALVALSAVTPPTFWPMPYGAPASAVQGAIALALAAAFWFAGIPWRFVAARLAGFGLLLSPWVAVILLAHGLAGGWAPAGAVCVKAALAMAAMLLVVNTTPFPRLLAALSGLRAPRLLVAALAAMHRYWFVLEDELVRLRRARQARTFRPARRLSAGQTRAAAATVGVLLVRSIARAERVHAAMLARGYTGQIPALGDRHGID